jgi:hypothetical protein
VDDVNGERPRLPCLILFVCSGLLQRREREGQYLFVLHTLSNIVIPLPLRRRLRFYFTFSFSKKCVRFVFLFSSALRHHNMPLFSSPRLSIRSLLPQRNLLPSRSPVCISYRSVLYYTTYLYSSKRLLYSNRHSTVFVFRIAMYWAAPYGAVLFIISSIVA